MKGKLFLVLTFILCCAAPSWSAAKKASARLEGAWAEQIGSHRVDLHFEGQRLSKPEIELIHDGTALLMVLRGTVSKERSFRFEVPLLHGAELKQQEKDLAVTLYGAESFNIEDITVDPLGQWIRLELMVPFDEKQKLEEEVSFEAPKVKIKGELLTLNFRDMDLHDALRLTGALVEAADRLFSLGVCNVFYRVVG